jgi:hypothetical protein
MKGRILLVVAAAVTVITAPVRAQDWGWEYGGYGERGAPPRFRPDSTVDGGFAFCRMMYRSVVREWGGRGWGTDYPYAEVNFSSRLAELTHAAVSFAGPDQPVHYVVRLTDPALFSCPFLMGSDVGTVEFSSEEAARLREYLLKGGFLWVDDFWGTAAWERWSREIAKVLPPAQYPIQEVPPTDQIFRSLYEVPRVPQITSLQNWRRSGGTNTSERGSDSAVPHLRAIRDPGGRIMVVMTHNTDIADSWEREGDDIEFFYRFAHDGYALGINVLLHSMTR